MANNTKNSMKKNKVFNYLIPLITLLIVGAFIPFLNSITEYSQGEKLSFNQKDSLDKAIHNNSDRKFELQSTENKYFIFGEKLILVDNSILQKQRYLDDIIYQINQALKEGSDITKLLKQYSDTEKELKQQIALREIQMKKSTHIEPIHDNTNIEDRIKKANSKLEIEKDRAKKCDC